MKRVLLLNNITKECGVQQWGIRLGNILSKSEKYDVTYKEVGNYFHYFNIVQQFKPDIILYNYHVDLMPWLNKSNLFADIKHIAIVHEGFSHIDDPIGFDYYIYVPQTAVISDNWKTRVFKIGRPLLEYTGIYPVNDIPTIGSFGFGFKHKQFPLIVKKVNEEFDNARVRINIPFQFKADPDGLLAKEEAMLCKMEVTKPGIILDITHEFLSEDDNLAFLAGNDLNAFFYDSSKLDSSSGATDFALSVDRPIAITNSPMFKHIIDKIGTAICIETHSFSDIIAMGTDVLSPLKSEWTNGLLIKDIEGILDHV